MEKVNFEEIERFAYRMRKHALRMSYAAGAHAVHFGAGMSMIDILAVLYSKVLRYDVLQPEWKDRDRFIMSKGHGVIGYYAALAEAGFISESELDMFEHGDTYLMGHPIYNPQHGIEFTNGSLGIGLGLGVGTAIAGKKREQTYRTYVMVGDGEMDEGAVWEAVMSAPQFNLNNLCLIVDRNHLQLGGETKEIMEHRNLKEKLINFGWKVFEIDGHNYEEIYNAAVSVGETEAPTAIVANTIKGKGFSFSENNNGWHHAVLTAKQYEQALQELENAYGH